MHLVVLQLFLCFAAFCDIGRGQTGQYWEKVPPRKVKNWASNVPNIVERFQPSFNGYAFPTESAATYRRKEYSSQAKTRILFVDYLGAMWSFSPQTASWARLSSITVFERLRGNTITTLCGTKVAVFGGYQESVPGSFSQLLAAKYASLTLFIGENEDAAEEQFFLSKESPLARFGHIAFAHHSNESTCECKESLFVYGGRSLQADYGEESIYTVYISDPGDLLHDFWEFRCVDEKSNNYKWIKIDNSLWQHTLLFSVDNEHIYWLRLYYRALGIFDVATKNGLFKGIDVACPISAKFSLRFHNGIVYDKNHRLLILQVYDQLGVYDVNKNRLHCVNFLANDVNKNLPAKIMIVEEKIIILSVKKQFNNRVQLWEAQTDDLLQILRNFSLDSILHFKEINIQNYPLFDGDARMFGISETDWYLMLQNDQKLQMWRFDNGAFVWTLYDPDQVPRRRKEHSSSLQITASARTLHKMIAFFGSNHSSYCSSSSDNLWMYKTNSREWIWVRYHGNGPNKLTSFATMNSLPNGELLLFGGIDNKTSSLWVATVNYTRMEATWKRICCDGQEAHEPTKQLQQWSSTVWNDTLYVYFQITNSTCNWTTYYTELSTNGVKWNSASIYNQENYHPKMTFKTNTIKHACGRQSIAMGRFAFTSDTDEDLIIQDLSKMTRIREKWVHNRLVAYGSGQTKHILLDTDGKIDSFAAYWDESKKKYAMLGGIIIAFKQKGCDPGENSSDYSFHPCRPCPMGQYNDAYGATTCTDCPPGLVTGTTGSTSIRNCTCAIDECVNGKCIVRSDFTTICICDRGFTGKACETPTAYLIGIGIIVALLLIAAFLYCTKRVKRHKNVEKYTRVELEMAEQTVAELANIWSVDKEEIVRDKMIGQGSFGDVWTAQYRDQTVAVKVLKIEAQDCTNEQLQEFKDESELLRSIFHANIVRFIGTGMTADNKPFIVLEYMERGSVRNELDDAYNGNPIEIKLQVKYALHAAKGMRHLHRINRMHRDLKCDNLLVNNLGIVKVADLGCTKIAPKISDENDGNVRGSCAVGTAFFRALEIFRREAYSIAVDVYSYGITLWEIMSAKRPYFDKLDQGLTKNEILDLIVRSVLRPEFPEHCPNSLTKLAKWCWNGNPQKRLTFEEIVLVLEGLWLTMW